MSADLNAQVIADYVTAAAEPHVLDPADRFHSVIIPNGASHKVIDLETCREALLPNPRRKTGTVAIHDAATFIAYLGKHAVDETEVWADLDKQALVAVINGHGSSATDDTGLPGHGDFRARLALTHTPAWAAWMANNGRLLTQLQFAEHIEARAIDIKTPSGAEMLEVAQSFQAKRNLSFESGRSLSTGEVQLEYREEIKESAGKKGNLSFPREIGLALIPFVGGDPYGVKARLRYRIADGNLQMGYLLERPEDVLADAFGQILEQVEAGIEVPVFRGTPAG